MRFSSLMAGVETRETGGDALVTGITHDAQGVNPGEIYVAIDGRRVDGHMFVDEALRRGAAGVVSTRRVALPAHMAWGIVPDSRLALAQLSAAWFGYPARSLNVVGVTGTNGKTTTTYMVKSILRAAGREVGLIGTVQTEIRDQVIPVKFTTPEAPHLQGLLRQMVDAGASHAVMEVSSHALSLRRVACIDFRTAIFTNLTQDHLDFHETMENYFQAKAGLFLGTPSTHPLTMVINADDSYGRRLIDMANGRVLRYGLDADVEISAADIRADARGSVFSLSTPWGSGKVSLPIPGLHNVYNALAAIGATMNEGATLDQVSTGLCGLRVPGRMEPVDEGQPFTVLVDYAHTPDGLENVLCAVSGFAVGRVIVVFGCGGDRDRGKRPLMGSIARQHADVVVVTSDNPRSEDPMDIINDILVGIDKSSTDTLLVEPDRRQAIELALNLAEPGDVVLIAGKGHETGQITRLGTFPFDDCQEAAKVLRKRYA